MSIDPKKVEAYWKLIRSNIAESGHHTNLICGGAIPRYAYTIGLREALGAELLLPGATFYSAAEVGRIINEVAVFARKRLFVESYDLVIESLGSFALLRAHPSWTNELALVALDYHETDDVPGLQIVPDDDHGFVDIPDTREPWSAEAEPLWRWMHEPWEYPVPESSTAITNLAALCGYTTTEAVRWEADEWEIFAGPGPDVPVEDAREVPLGTMLAVDPSLVAVTELAVGEGLYRDADGGPWRPRRKKARKKRR